MQAVVVQQSDQLTLGGRDGSSLAERSQHVWTFQGGPGPSPSGVLRVASSPQGDKGREPQVFHEQQTQGPPPLAIRRPLPSESLPEAGAHLARQEVDLHHSVVLLVKPHELHPRGTIPRRLRKTPESWTPALPPTPVLCSLGGKECGQASACVAMSGGTGCGETAVDLPQGHSVSD